MLTTPFPSARSCWTRERPSSSAVTQPSDWPIIHSTKRADRFAFPLGPIPVGSGAVLPIAASQRLIAGA